MSNTAAKIGTADLWNARADAVARTQGLLTPDEPDADVRKMVDRIGPAMLLFFAQLGFNLLWTLVFFGLRSPAWALVEVVFLVGSVLLTMLAFFGRQVTAGWLFVPYLAWVSFAAVLNFAIWSLN